MSCRLGSVLFVVVFARLANAQATDTTHHVAGATVSGVVRDSIARVPLGGAMVQLVAADSPARLGRMAVSDSSGRFTLSDVPDGRYMLGFIHPMLDSLGVEVPLREVYVDGHRPVIADLAIPSAARLRAAICGARPASDSGGVLLGVVRDALDGAPVAGVKVSGDWLEFSLGRGGLQRRLARLVATTGANGWFALCNVPSAGTVALLASRGADSTDLIEVQVPAEGFLRRELYLGHAETVVTGETPQRVDSLAPPPRRVHMGDGRLSGTVIAAAGGKPLVGAQVSISDGPQTRANERGEWTLVNAPVGTRMLEVHSLGYYPERRRVDVVAGAAPVHVALSTLEAVLDTVKILATRLGNGRDSNGFNSRRRSGAGNYLTPADVARRQPRVTSDLFSTLPGVRLDYERGLGRNLSMRGAFGRCTPAVYIDDHYMRNLGADDIDDWVRPQEIAGIEIYTDGTVPPQFQAGLSGCGSVVIWTKRFR
ncbi:MAG TPA: carboxypeptidase regulatory-like domain-containing protein [Gemmatimonadaceae bacterium]